MVRLAKIFFFERGLAKILLAKKLVKIKSIIYIKYFKKQAKNTKLKKNGSLL